jgi:hypothetical protein
LFNITLVVVNVVVVHEITALAPMSPWATAKKPREEAFAVDKTKRSGVNGFFFGPRDYAGIYEQFDRQYIMPLPASDERCPDSSTPRNCPVGKEPQTLTSWCRGVWAETKNVCGFLRAGPGLSFQVGPYEVEGILTEAGVKLAVFLVSERGHELRYAVDGTTDVQYTMNTFNHIRRRTIVKDGEEERITNTRFVHVVDFERELQREACTAKSAIAAAAVLLIKAYPLAQRPSLIRSWGPAMFDK